MYYNESKLTELVLIMNKREIVKEKTRDLILKTAKEIFSHNGFLTTNTLSIARECGIAHGTLFLHFKNKETLISTIFKNELIRIANELYRITEESKNMENLLDSYLLFLENDESFFVITAKEFPFYPEKLKNEILNVEVIIRNFFYRMIEDGINAGIYKELDITDTIAFLFGTINYYLTHKELIVFDGSVINSKKESIKSIFYKLLQE